MDFELGENFAFNQKLARDLVDNQTHIRPLPEHLLLLERVCHVCGRGDREWPVIRKSGERDEMSLRDALKVPNFSLLDFDFDELTADEDPFLKQTPSAAHEIRAPVDPKTSVAITSDPESAKEAAGSFGVQVRVEPLVVEEDSDPEVHQLDQALLYPTSAVIAKGKGVSSDSTPKGLVRKRKAENLQLRSADSLPLPKLVKKVKKATSSSTDNVLTDLTEHLSGGKSSREEAARARSVPSVTFSSGLLPVDEAEVMETVEPAVTSKDGGKVLGEGKMVTFSGTILGSSLGPDCFLDDDEDQVSSLPSSLFGPEVMTFFRYADVFSDEMEVESGYGRGKVYSRLGYKEQGFSDGCLYSQDVSVWHQHSGRPLSKPENEKPGSGCSGVSQPSSIEHICG
ncbi:hypothetical protein HanRHA438_Chr15g0710221 [Helianthus annuus]|uniref:Uncharacterized protein n=1 Tax=Helianthus annuus TaxID=4232 RepID=A0A9K3E297_HELAN|nr:hypothetical protein HanXRQr2_Chr15g0698081 [Helianthus annuus]KAJ0451565.1 hypothetical protein HanHA300_Chr15g0568981 [Helianthus annuus]KAJ0456113.1 hypothetical protein HanIR_Chr15g0758751 [Helianthus annuus]KAJ0473441.1 hypothetical protein HanHA89_Chr15g0618351 [Helianthus annuus]KAJ0649025.1 hypothetical protein HanLR1_Chr15g0579501 [Helianthus annuus]